MLVIFVVSACPTFGWDDNGHKLSARIAWEVMTPGARENAIKALLAAPEDSDLNVIYNAYGGRSEAARRLELFMFAATWPDVVRNRAFAVRYEKYNHGDWHYAGIFFDKSGKELADFPEPRGKAIEKLKDFETTLRDADAPESEKAVALAWFLHVAADIHNPVHNASRVTAEEPKGDRGGNLFYLEPPKSDGSWRLNLHAFWDSQITRNVPRMNDACDDAYLEPIEKVDMALNPLAAFGDELELGDYGAWNREGFAYLHEDVYKGLVRDELPNAKYRRFAFTLSMKQLALAGYRIGETLNSIFDPKP